MRPTSEAMSVSSPVAVDGMPTSTTISSSLSSFLSFAPASTTGSLTTATTPTTATTITHEAETAAVLMSMARPTFSPLALSAPFTSASVSICSPPLPLPSPVMLNGPAYIRELVSLGGVLWSSPSSSSSSSSPSSPAAVVVQLRIAAPTASPYSGATFTVDVSLSPACLAPSSLSWRWTSPIYHPLFAAGQTLCSCMLVDADGQPRAPEQVLRHVQLLLEKPHYTARGCPSCRLQDQALAEALDDHAFFVKKARVRTPGADPLSDDDLRGMCHTAAVGAAAIAPCTASTTTTTTTSTPANSASASSSTQPSSNTNPSMDFGYLLTSGIFSDVRVVVGKTAFRCHRTILAARSPVFRRLFDEGSDHGQVRINGSSPVAFARLLQYVYGSRLTRKEDLAMEQHFELFHLASTYGVVGLRNYHLGCMTSLLTPAYISWLLAKAESSNSALLFQVVNTFLAHHPEALQSQSRDSPGPARRQVSRARDVRHSPY